MATAVVLSTKVLHSARIFAVVEQAIAEGTLVDAKSIAVYARAKLQGVLAGMSA